LRLVAVFGVEPAEDAVFAHPGPEGEGADLGKVLTLLHVRRNTVSTRILCRQRGLL
jgi:hypothetical protein